MSDNPSVLGVSHIVMPVADVGETIEFYTSHLDFKLLRRYGIGETEYCYLELGGVLLELVPLRGKPVPEGAFGNPIGLRVTDLDAMLARLRSHGIDCGDAIEARTFWGRQAKIHDNTGYLVSLREYNEPDGPSYPDWTPRHDDVVRLDK